MPSGDACTLMLKFPLTLCDPLSVTCAVKLNPPAAVGVPLRVPSAANETPGGRPPAGKDHEYGGVPPVAERDAEYVLPIVPSGIFGPPLMRSGCGLTVSERLAPALAPAESLTVTLALKFPGAEGFP